MKRSSKQKKFCLTNLRRTSSLFDCKSDANLKGESVMKLNIK